MTDIGMREEFMLLSQIEVIDRILRDTLKFENATKAGVVINPETVQLATKLNILRTFCLHRGYRGESSVYQRDLWSNKPKFACAICRRDFRVNPNGMEVMSSV